MDDLPEEEASDGALGGSLFMCRGHASPSRNPCDELICLLYIYILGMYINISLLLR